MTGILLSIDLGTTRLKVNAFTTDGTLQEQRHRRHRDHYDAQGSWQEPDDWWRDVTALVREVHAAVSARLPAAHVLGLSLSGRGNAAVFADAGGAVVTPPWADGRQRDERDHLERAYPGVLPPYTAAMLAKCLWLRSHAPERFRRVRYAFYAKDFLLFRLTGVHATDWSSGPDGPRWPVMVLDELGIAESLLPRPALPWDVAGTLTPAASRLLGLPSGTPVAVGAHDGVCANVGAGATGPGDYAITLGTNAVVRAVTDSVPAGAYRFYCLPEARHVIGGNALMAGRAADWYADLAGYPEAGREQVLVELEAAARDVAIGADDVRFLPYLGGQVAPRRRPRVRGVLAGLDVRHGRGAGYRAVLEGSAFALAAVFRQVHGWCGEPRRVRLTGGGARSALWTGILAAVLDRPFELTGDAVEGRGAAMLLAVGLGLHDDYDAAAAAMVSVVDTREPDREAVAAYRAIARDWADLDELIGGFRP